MKKPYLSIIFACVGFFAIAAEDDYNISNEFTEESGVTLVQPDKLRQRLQRVNVEELVDENGESVEKEAPRAVTFSVEVFADNSRQAEIQANARRRNMQQRFPQYTSRLEYETPFWRVKVGNFVSRSDAEEALALIRREFPAYASYLRIVRNKM